MKPIEVAHLTLSLATFIIAVVYVITTWSIQSRSIEAMALKPLPCPVYEGKDMYGEVVVMTICDSTEVAPTKEKTNE